MSTNKIVSIVVFCIIALLCLGGCSSYMSYNNREVALRAEADGQIKIIEATHDKMWKTISQKAQISDQYRESFDSIYSHIISERYQNNDNVLFNWIKESNPEFDASLYKDVMMSVDVERSSFLKAQTRMVDIVREHSTLCQTMPACWFIRNTTPIKFEVISSTKSKYVMETGVDDDVDLFKN